MPPLGFERQTAEDVNATGMERCCYEAWGNRNAVFVPGAEAACANRSGCLYTHEGSLRALPLGLPWPWPPERTHQSPAPIFWPKGWVAGRPWHLGSSHSSISGGSAAGSGGGVQSPPHQPPKLCEWLVPMATVGWPSQQPGTVALARSLVSPEPPVATMWSRVPFKPGHTQLDEGPETP